MLRCAPTVPTSAASGDFSILAVDDSALYRALVQRSLVDEGYSISFASTGEEALRSFEVRRPEIVITDWTMPDVSGIEFCRQVRSALQEPYPYIILLTAHSEKEHVIEGLTAGADDYLTKPFDPGELRARVRVGIRMAELHRELTRKNLQLQELAMTDSLTGLANRRAVDSWVEHELSAAMRHQFPFWVVLADLDHFKHVNDKYGHDVGDSVLKRFADILAANTRKSNFCGRLGGEEFIVVLAHAKTKDDVRTAVERIREPFANFKFEAGGSRLSVTASFGVAGLRNAACCTFRDLLARADAALYQAKKKRRNCIVFEQELEH